MTFHNLKTWPKYYNAIVKGEKNFEIRKNDRDFQTGDVVQLQEWDPVTEQYTGRQIRKKIGFIIDSEWGLHSGWCVFSLLPDDTVIRE